MRNHVFTGILVAFMAGCAVHAGFFDQTAAAQAVFDLREEHRNAHFDKDAAKFVATFTKDFISVNKGVISRPSREESKDLFQGYFDAVEFVKWDDVAEPEIRFSDDGSMAYVVTEKQVDLTYPGSEGQTYLDQTRFAWIAIYRKTDSGWKVEAIASTNKEPENKMID